MKYTVYLFILSSLISCSSQGDEAVPNAYAAGFVRELNNSDTFRFDRPFGFYSWSSTVDSSGFFQRSKFTRMLGIKNLEQGTDSICIRVHYSVSLLSTSVMLELKNTGGKWIAEVSKIKSHFNSVEERVDSFSRVMRVDYPRSGWIKLINQLFELNILSLDDDSVIPRDLVSAVNDGDGIEFEIATNNTYRNYAYSNPDFQPKEIWQVRNVIRIKELLWTEFRLLKKWDDQIIQDFEEELRENKRHPPPPRKDTMVRIMEIKD